MRVDPDDPRERMRRAREMRLKARDPEAAEAKKNAKFVSALFLKVLISCDILRMC